MYSFIYLGCIPFTTAKLTKGGVVQLISFIPTFGEYGTVYNVHFWLV